MKVLFIGGSGVISSGCIEPILERGIELFLLNRGTSRPGTEGVDSKKLRRITADIHDSSEMQRLIEEEYFDVVVDWIAFTVEDVERDIRLFSGKVGQYVFISSASAYQKPPAALPIRESSPLCNPFWDYSRDKIACEERLTEEYRRNGFPVTIIRPSHTYGNKMIPSIFDRGPMILDRLRRGKELIVPGDGTSRWVVTHNSDFAKALRGLLGAPQALGEAYTITSDEALTWDQIHRIIASKLGLEAKIRHIPADFITAHYPEFTGPLHGDKIHSVDFDNSKVKSLVPDFLCTTPFHLGVEGSIRYFDTHPEEFLAEDALDRKLDDIIAKYAHS